MKKVYLLLIGAFVLVSFHGCASHQAVAPSRYYKPLNSIQQKFYDIQTLYDNQQYSGVVEAGSAFIKEYKRDILAIAVNYYIASSYQSLGQLDDAEKYYKIILTTNPDDEWGKLATVGMAEIKDSREKQ